LAQAIHRKLQLSSPGQLGILAIKDFHDDFPARARFSAPTFFFMFFFIYLYFLYLCILMKERQVDFGF
jgi:hypothetical protein